MSILYTNDLHAHLLPSIQTRISETRPVGGFANIATLVREKKLSDPDTIYIDSGDYFSGPYVSTLTKGAAVIESMNYLGLDVACIGNHEFEYNWEPLVEIIPRANFPVLNANIFIEKTGELIARPFTVLKKSGVKIGVIGVMGIDAFYNTMAPFHRTGLSIKDPIETVQYWADKIRDDVDMIIVLTHQNKTAPMQTNKESDPSVQRGFDEDYQMAGELRGVDAIFGGHSDNGLLKPVKHPETGIMIGLTFGQGMHLGYTKFKVDTQKHDAEFIEGYLIPVNSNQLPEDKQTAALINDYRKMYPELLEVLATVNEPLMRKYNQESDIGNLLTDYMREAAQSDIAFLNSGAIRADFNTGNVTLEQLINVYPFKDNLTVIELTGNQIKELIEYSLTLPYGIGQISGLKIKYDSSLNPMKRVIDIKVDGKDLIASKKYTVSVSGYLAKGGDGYRVFTEGRFVNDEKPFQDALYEGFKKAKIIKIPASGRIIDVSN